MMAITRKKLVGPKLLISISVLMCLASDPIESAMSDGKIVPADRIKNEPESVWEEFGELARKTKALNLGQGFPDYPPPNFIVDFLHNATNLADPTKWNNHQYTRSNGHPRLVKAIVDYYNEFRAFKQLTEPKSQVLVTVGATGAIFSSLMAYVNPGDEVLLVEPAYDAYAANTRLASGEPVSVPLRLRAHQLRNNSGSLLSSSADFQLDMEEFERKISPKTKVLVLNTPNNPTGKIFSRSELEAIAKLCIKHNILVISDEVYEQIYYSSSEPHTSIASLPGMWERTLTIGSAGKTFSVTGWKVGWVFGPKELVKYVQLVHAAAVQVVATPLQEAVAQGFEHEMDVLRRNQTGFWKQGLQSDLLVKRDRMARILAKANMKPVIPQGSYFMVADFSALAKQYPEYQQKGRVEGRPNTKDFKFARWLSREKKLQVIPVGSFYSEENKPLAENLVRFCFIKQEATLDKLEAIIDGLRSQETTAHHESLINELQKSRL